MRKAVVVRERGLDPFRNDSGVALTSTVCRSTGSNINSTYCSTDETPDSGSSAGGLDQCLTVG